MYVFVVCNCQKPGTYIYTDPDSGRLFKFDYCPVYVASGEGDKIYTYYNSIARRYDLDPSLVKDFATLKMSFHDVAVIVEDDLTEYKAMELENQLKSIIGMEVNDTGPLKNKSLKQQHVDPETQLHKSFKMSGRFIARLLNFSHERIRLMIQRGYIVKDSNDDKQTFTLETIFKFIKDRNLVNNVNDTILEDVFRIYPGSSELYHKIVLGKE